MSSRKAKRSNNSKKPSVGQPSSPSAQCAFVPLPRVQSVRIEPTTESNTKDANEKRNREEQLALSKRLNKITAWSAGISFFALVGLIISLYFTRQSTRAAIAQSDTAQREYRSSQRPWLALSASSGLLEDMGNSVMIWANFEVRNVGHTVATHVHVGGHIVNTNVPFGHACDVTQQYKDRNIEIIGGVAVFPEQTFKDRSPAIETKEKLKIPPNQQNLFADYAACVLYTSPIDGTWHETEVRYYITRVGQNASPTDSNQNQLVALVPRIEGTTAN